MSSDKAVLSTDQVKQDVDTAIESGNGFRHVFDEVHQAIIDERSKSPQQVAADLQVYRQTINQELQAHGFPTIDINFGKNQGAETSPIDIKPGQDGAIHVYDHATGKELSQETLKPLSDAVKTDAGASDGGATNTGAGNETKASKSDAEPTKTDTGSGQGDGAANLGDGASDNQRLSAAAPQSSDQSAYWKAHERKNNQDGSSDITIQKGDSLWKISEHLCEERLGHKMDPTNLKDMQQVYRLTKELAAAQHPPVEIKDGHAKIVAGETLHIPPAKDSVVKPSAQPTDTSTHTNTNPTGDASQHADKHGKIAKDGDTTTITLDRGVTTVKLDKSGNATDYTYKNKQGTEHWVKEGDHKWKDASSGKEWDGDISVSQDGSINMKSTDGKLISTYHANGSSVENNGGNGPTKIQSADGANSHSYTKGDDGHWKDEKGNSYDDVTIDSKGNVSARNGDITKTMYTDGSERDSDSKGAVSYIESPEGKNQHKYTKDAQTGKWKDESGKQYDDVSMDNKGNITTKSGDSTQTISADSSPNT